MNSKWNRNDKRNKQATQRATTAHLKASKESHQNILNSFQTREHLFIMTSNSNGRHLNVPEIKPHEAFKHVLVTKE